ncbi:MAG: hypothetical protein GC160_29530 [Acidobacteria bacterium]|nr:hypothetical protein [Acidobacteriota bacterium]
MRRIDFFWTLTAGALAVGLAACEKKDAGDHLEDAVEDIGDAADDAADEVGDAVDKATDK